MIWDSSHPNIQPQVYFKTSLLSPEFSSNQQIWSKNPLIQFKNKSSVAKFKFYKIGKIFGIFTKRTLFIQNHMMIYYQNQNDKEMKGYCSLKNLYVGFFIVDTKYRFGVYFTNYKQTMSMYFQKESDVINFKSKIAKYVIQLRYKSKFQDIRELGEGSFAKVFLVKKKGDKEGIQYAVKVINKIDKNKTSNKQAVEQEKHITQIVSSQYLSKIYQFYEDNNNYYLVLEYIPGKSLMDLLKEDYQFNSGNKQYILKQILQGLIHLHDKKIIHRDLKPQNIIVNLQHLKTKIIDLGLGLKLEPGLKIENYKRCGTMGYIAPQIISNNSKNKKSYGCKTDIFSFGIICHLLLLGNNPLKGKTYEQTTYLNKNFNIQLNQQSIVNRYGQSCFDFLNGCLQLSQTKRFSALQALNHNFFKEKLKIQNIETVLQFEKQNYPIDMSEEDINNPEIQDVQKQFKNKVYA